MIFASLIPDPFSRSVRPILKGSLGAISAAHPLATAAAQAQINNGGSAADAVVAAQAVLSVVAPEAGGLGGDAFYLIKDGPNQVLAINAAGRTPRRSVPMEVRDDGTSVNVPGMVAGWKLLHQQWGRRRLRDVLAPSIRLAKTGFPIRGQLNRALAAQRDRLLRGGANNWAILSGTNAGLHPPQPELEKTLESLALRGLSWFYEGEIAREAMKAIQHHHGLLEVADFADHRAVITSPLTIKWRDVMIHLQPPMSQGVLLGMALRGLDKLGSIDRLLLDHAAIELTEAAFAYRDRTIEGEALFSERLDVDLDRAARRGGPRAFLHTAGVAASDASGLVIASLLSVFDDFGSGVFVPECGFFLNNRAAGFTQSPNEIAPGKLPVHTLAPILIEYENGCAGLATPGADGQVQTLMQVLISAISNAQDLDIAIHQPRWRTENRSVLIESRHSNANLLTKFGHDVVVVADGDTRFGSVVCAGAINDTPFAVADWRRESWSAVV